MAIQSCTENTGRIDYTKRIPEEMLLHVFSNLGPQELAQAAQVNKLWGRVAQSQMPVVIAQIYGLKHPTAIPTSTISHYLMANALFEAHPNPSECTDMTISQLDELFGPYYADEPREDERAMRDLGRYLCFFMVDRYYKGKIPSTINDLVLDDICFFAARVYKEMIRRKIFIANETFNVTEALFSWATPYPVLHVLSDHQFPLSWPEEKFEGSILVYGCVLHGYPEAFVRGLLKGRQVLFYIEKNDDETDPHPLVLASRRSYSLPFCLDLIQATNFDPYSPEEVIERAVLGGMQWELLVHLSQHLETNPITSVTCEDRVLAILKNPTSGLKCYPGALDAALKHRWTTQCIEALMERGAEPLADEFSLLHALVHDAQDIKLIQLVLSKNASLNDFAILRNYLQFHDQEDLFSGSRLFITRYREKLQEMERERSSFWKQAMKNLDRRMQLGHACLITEDIVEFGTALNVALNYDASDEVFQALLDHGHQPVNSTFAEFNTCDIAEAKGRARLLALLKDRGALSFHDCALEDAV